MGKPCDVCGGEIPFFDFENILGTKYCRKCYDALMERMKEEKEAEKKKYGYRMPHYKSDEISAALSGGKRRY